MIGVVDRVGGDAGADGLSTFRIAEFLVLPEIEEGFPEVVVGGELLNRRIRWLHVTDLIDTEGVFQGGELVLTTGVALPSDAAEVGAYVDGLADQGVVGLVMELGRRFERAPADLARACRRRRLPLVLLHREVRFVRVTEAAHSAILGGQRALLQLTAAAHARFTELSLSDSSLDEVVAAAGDLTGGDVIFSNLLHHVIALHAEGGLTEELHSRWRRKVFRLGASFGTVVDADDGTVATPVEVRGRQRGLLTAFVGGPPTPAQVMVVERAAAAVTIKLLLESEDALVAGAHRSLLADLVSGRFTSTEAVHARASSLGHPIRGRHLLPVVVLSDMDELGTAIQGALDGCGADGISGRIADGQWGLVLILDDDDIATAEAFAARVHETCSGTGPAAAVLARGGVVTEVAAVRRSFNEALEVAHAAFGSERARRSRPLYSIHDIQLRGLLYTLRDDPRLQAFVERLLGPLLVRDERDGEEWVRTLSTYLRLRGNKSLAAQQLGISRPTLYERLSRIQRMLHVDIDDPEASTSLYAAIMVVESMAGTGRRAIDCARGEVHAAHQRR